MPGSSSLLQDRMCKTSVINDIARQHDVVCLDGSDTAFGVMYLAHNNTAFVYGDCLNDFCRNADEKRLLDETKSNVDALDNTELLTPCKDNHKGILCGECLPGYANKPYYLVRFKDQNCNPSLSLYSSPPTFSLFFCFYVSLLHGFYSLLVSFHLSPSSTTPFLRRLEN